MSNRETKKLEELKKKYKVYKKFLIAKEVRKTVRYIEKQIKIIHIYYKFRGEFNTFIVY